MARLVRLLRDVVHLGALLAMAAAPVWPAQALLGMATGQPVDREDLPLSLCALFLLALSNWIRADLDYLKTMVVGMIYCFFGFVAGVGLVWLLRGSAEESFRTNLAAVTLLATTGAAVTLRLMIVRSRASGRDGDSSRGIEETTKDS